MNHNPIPELTPQLKALRLSGILDSLEARNRQAIEGKLAYTEFLAMLIGDEIARRESKKFSMRLRRAQFRTTKTLEQFDFERLPKLNRALVHDLATGRYLHEKAPVLIVGPTGCGKTWLGCALAQQAARQGFSVLYARATRLLQELQVAHGDGSFGKRLAALARLDLLVLDDLAIAPVAAQERQDLLELLDDRAGSRSTLITSQLPTSAWHQWLSEPTIADAIMDRLLHGSHTIALKGESLRRAKPQA